jgi:hypothetical protein
MTTATATQDEQPIARPLRELARLIHKDLEAAEHAGMPFYLAAGEKLLEAKSQLPHGEFGPWIKHNLEISRTSAHRYMKLAQANGAQMFHAGNISSMRDFRRRHLGEDTSRKARPREWTEQAKRLLQDGAGRTSDRRAQYDLALKIINTGYRSLAAKLHPDVGGSQIEMATLNRARDHLKQFA